MVKKFSYISKVIIFSLTIFAIGASLDLLFVNEGVISPRIYLLVLLILGAEGFLPFYIATGGYRYTW